MNPLLFQFKETPVDESIDFSQVEYDKKLNLSVNNLTGRPAIAEIELGTETFTRVTGEATDSDFAGSNIGALMATETHTKSGEGVDSDRDRFGAIMETATTTMVSTEGTDSDK